MDYEQKPDTNRFDPAEEIDIFEGFLGQSLEITTEDSNQNDQVPSGFHRIKAIPADKGIAEIIRKSTRNEPLSGNEIKTILEISRTYGLLNGNSPLAYALGLQPLDPRKGGLTPSKGSYF
ncbi:MAG: hypothetical protein AABW46_00130 [Nanoarchaeota archaeon]